MKKYLLSIALILFLTLDINSHVDHYSKYNYLEYELFRNNKPIGFHKYFFKRNGTNLIINNEVNFKISKLGVDLYKYYAKGQENYENGIPIAHMPTHDTSCTISVDVTTRIRFPEILNLQDAHPF